MRDEQKIFMDELLAEAGYRDALDRALADADVDVINLVPRSLYEIKARPSGYWNNTGVYKPKGIALCVRYVSGNWKSNPHWSTNDAAGNSNFPAPSSYLCPGAPEGCMIGKVGGDKSAGGGHVIRIGNLGFVSPDLEGLLWLTVNDEKIGFGDNSGSIRVAISKA